MTEQADRTNAGKNRLGLMSFPALWELGKVYTAGCMGKYKPRNWERGAPYSEVLDCAMRHLFKAVVGHKFDTDLKERTGTDIWHWSQAIWNLLMIQHMELFPEKYGRFNDLPDYSTAIPDTFKEVRDEDDPAV